MIGARIAALRRQAGMNQAKLAALLGVSPSAVGMYEQGRREPSADVLVALGKIMKAKNLPGELSFDHLMGCGVGACFGCVVKVAADTPEGWAYARACKDGPVFDIDKCYLDE